MTHTERVYLKPEYHPHHFMHPDHVQQQQQLQNNNSFYQLHQQSDGSLLETEHRPRATLHHRPEPFQQNYQHHESRYFNTEPQYSHTSLPETAHQIDLNCSWHDQQVTTYNKESCHMQPQNYQQTPCVPHASLASFTASLQPESSSECQQDPMSIPQNPTFSMMPFQQSSFEVNTSHLANQHGSILPHQNEIYQSNQQCLFQKESLQSNQPFQNQQFLVQNESLNSHHPFKNQHCLHQNESLLLNSQFQNESAQSNHLPLQQHLSVKQIHPLLDQHSSTKSNHPEQLFCSYDFSARSNLSNHHAVVSAASVQEPQQTVVMFSHSKSSVVHHKPVPVPRHDNEINACSTDGWQVYFQLPEPHLNTHQDLVQPFSSNTSNMSIKAPASSTNEEFCTNKHQISNHMNTIQGSVLPERVSFNSMPECIVLENSINRQHSSYLELSKGVPCKTIPECIVPENSINRQHSSYLELSKGVPCKTMPECIVPENSTNRQHSSYLELSKGVPCKTISECIVPENSINRQHSSYLELSKGVPCKTMPECIVPENSINRQHSSYLELSKGVPCKTMPECIVPENSINYQHSSYLELSKGVPCKTMPECIVPENRQNSSYLELSKGVLCKTMPECIVPENSNNHQQIGNQNMNQPLLKKVSFNDMVDGIVPLNSDSHKHRDHMNSNQAKKISFINSLPNCIVADNSSNYLKSDHITNLNQTKKISFNNMSSCLASEDSSIHQEGDGHNGNLYLSKELSCESMPDCIVTENSSSRHHVGDHNMNLNLPKRASVSMPNCVSLENSNIRELSGDHNMNLSKRESLKSLPNSIIQKDSYFNREPVKIFLSSSNDLQDSYSSVLKETISPALPLCSLLSNPGYKQSAVTVVCSSTAEDNELSINTLSGGINQRKSHFSCIMTQDDIINPPDERKNDSEQDINANFCNKPCKLNSEVNSFSNIVSDTSEIMKNKGQFFEDNEVDNIEDDNDDDFEDLNELQPSLNKQTNEFSEKALTRRDADVGPDGNDTLLSSKSKSHVVVRTRPYRLECVSKYRHFPQHGCHGTTQNTDHMPESLHFSGSIKNNKPSGHLFSHLKQNMVDSKISKIKQENINPVPKLNYNPSEEFNKSFCNKTLGNYINCSKNAENVNGRKLSRKTQSSKEELEKDNKLEDKLKLARIEKKLIQNPEKLKICKSIGDGEKVDLIERKSIKKPGKIIEKIKLLRKEYKQGIHLDNQPSIKNFDELRHKCQTCGKTFPNNSRLQRHIKTHMSQKPFPCSRCPQAFTAKRYLDNHMSRHDKQPPIFACGDCGKTFPRRYQLKIHYRTHSGEKPYKCSHCSSHFATSFQVRLHERVHSDNLAFQCRFCGKLFRSNTNLSLHVKRHTKDKPYLCATCGASFYEASKLKAHIRVHTGIHPFMCDQCPKTFKVKHLLVRHLRWHNDDTFKCEHCRKPFDERWILKAHMQKHHPGL